VEYFRKYGVRLLAFAQLLFPVTVQSAPEDAVICFLNSVRNALVAIRSNETRPSWYQKKLSKEIYSKTSERQAEYEGEQYGINVPHNLKTFVQYVSDEVDREAYRVHVSEGRLLDFEGKQIGDKDYEQRYIFVMDPAGNIYASKLIVGVFHHSSFLAGAPVAAAGELRFKNGKLIAIINKSGHYKPSPDQLNQFVDRLKLQNVDISSVEVKDWYAGEN